MSPGLGPERLASLWAAKMRSLAQSAAPEPPPAEPLPAPATDETTPSRDQVRSRRKRETKARTVNLRTLGNPGHEDELYPERPGIDYGRPATRADCEGAERPCPYVSCKFHLYLDVGENGSIKLNFPDIEVWEMPESCILDLAARDGMTLEEVGTILNVTRERVRQLETRAERRLRRRSAYKTGALAEIAQGLDLGGKRRLPLAPADVDADPDEEEDAAPDDDE